MQREVFPPVFFFFFYYYLFTFICCIPPPHHQTPFLFHFKARVAVADRSRAGQRHSDNMELKEQTIGREVEHIQHAKTS